MEKFFHKAESERTTAEKVVRNIVFIAVIAFASIMIYKVIDAETVLLEETVETIPGAPTTVIPVVAQEEPIVIGEVDEVIPTVDETTGEVITPEAPEEAELIVE